MATLRYFCRNIVNNSTVATNGRIQINNSCAVCIRLLNYSSIEYDGKKDPAPYFFSKEVQSLLKTLTRVNLSKVFRPKKLGDKKLEDPQYQFMTDEQLQAAIEEAKRKADEMLQIPPVIAVRQPLTRIFSKDPALQGIDTSRMVFTDITFGIKNADRLIVVREPDGTLQEAEWDVRNRINNVYFPEKTRSMKPPKMFEDKYFEDLLKRQEFEFILDIACNQFEPNDPEYQRVVSITYQHINDNNGFELLRSTRHFGALTFFLVWNKNIDNLLLELIETLHIEEGNKLIQLYSKIHNVTLESDNDIRAIEDYISKYSTKRGALELGMQAYKDLLKQKDELERGIKIAHGLS